MGAAFVRAFIDVFSGGTRFEIGMIVWVCLTRGLVSVCWSLVHPRRRRYFRLAWMSLFWLAALRNLSPFSTVKEPESDRFDPIQFPPSIATVGCSRLTSAPQAM